MAAVQGIVGKDKNTPGMQVNHKIARERSPSVRCCLLMCKLGTKDTEVFVLSGGEFYFAMVAH